MNWELFIKIAVPLFTMLLGAWLNKKLQDKPNLVSYLGQTFAIRTKLEDGTEIKVNTHSVILRNAGKKATKNVRVSHYVLPAFQVYPDKRYRIEDLPNGGKSIVFDEIVPSEELTINYLYSPPLLFTGINSSTSSEDGFAKIVKMQLIPQQSKLFNYTVAFLVLLGVATVLYAAISLVIYFLR